MVESGTLQEYPSGFVGDLERISRENTPFARLFRVKTLERLVLLSLLWGESVHGSFDCFAAESVFAFSTFSWDAK